MLLIEPIIPLFLVNMFIDFTGSELLMSMFILLSDFDQIQLSVAYQEFTCAGKCEAYGSME